MVKSITQVGTGVATQHIEYTYFMDEWETLRHHLTGGRKIKEQGEEYLPRLSGQNDDEYEAYKMRAVYYEATRRTHQAMLGAILSKPPTYSEPDFEDEYADTLRQVTPDGYSFQTFIRNVLSEVISLSRCGVLVDLPLTGGDVPYFVLYKAEDIINWRYERIEDEIILTLVVLRETEEEAQNRFGTQLVNYYRVLELIDGVYVQSRYREVIADKEGQRSVNLIPAEEDIVPQKIGEPLTRIPFVFFTPKGNVPHCETPLLMSIADINASHYRTSADLEHGRHFTGLPTAWVAGFDTDMDLRIGSTTAWVSDNPSARAGFLEFTGAGLTSLQTALAEKQEQMATMGARMLRAPRTGVEAAETARIYQSAESGTLASLAQAVGESFTDLLRHWLRWQGEDDSLSMELNQDYVDQRIDAAMLTALMNAWIGGGISYETLFYNLRQGEVVPDSATPESEREKIEMEGPVVPPTDAE